MTWKPPTCDIPGCHKQARKCERLEPRNLHSLYSRLCPDHARRRGYVPVHHPTRYGAIRRNDA